MQMRHFLSLWEAIEAAELEGAELTGLQFWTLLCVFQAGELTVSQIAAQLRVDQTTTSRTVDALVRRHLLDRRISETDLRQRVISILPEGAALAEACWARLQARMAAIELPISPTLRERGRKMIAKMIEGAAAAPQDAGQPEG